MESILLMLYAGAIPVVPLVGFDIFRKRGDVIKQWICFALFAAQLVISGTAIYVRFFA